MTVLVNGEPVSSIDIHDRGLQYGDGLFETIAVKDGQCEHWYEHMARLSQGCQRLKIPEPDPQQLLVEAQQLYMDKRQAVLKIIITRGSGGRGYTIPQTVRPSRILSLHEWPVYPSINVSLGVQVRFCDTRLSQQPALAGIKHLNRLEQVLARNEWSDSDVSEGLMCDSQGNVIEGTMSNCFMVKDGALFTPDITNAGVAGIMRAHVLQQARAHNIPVDEKPITQQEFLSANEVFICNSIIGIWPVRQLQDTHYHVIGDITAQLMQGLV